MGKGTKGAAGADVLEPVSLEFWRRLKPQGSLPSEDAALILLFSFVASEQIKLRRINGWRKITAVLSQRTGWRHDDAMHCACRPLTPKRGEQPFNQNLQRGWS